MKKPNQMTQKIYISDATHNYYHKFIKKKKNQNSVPVMLKSGLPVLLLDSDTLIGSPIKPSSYAHVSIANLKSFSNFYLPS